MAEWFRAGERIGDGGRLACRGRVLALVALLLCSAVGGCVSTPRLVAVDQRNVIDRQNIDYPGGFQFEPFIRDLTAPTAITFDDKGSILIAESPPGGGEPRIFGFRTNGTYFDVYPLGKQLLFGLNSGLLTNWRMYGPIGGMIFYQGKLYVSHRDAAGFGLITALDYAGHHTTVIGGLPAQGEYSVTDMTIGSNGRLYFGLGTATNSGVVGLDDWAMGWVRRHPQFHDVPYGPLDGKVQLRGFRFSSDNPMAGLFGPAEEAVTGTFQAFNNSDQTTVEATPANKDKPSGAIFSVDPAGGDLRLEAYGIHNPRGLAFNEYGRLYFTNDGMEMRGTRPVRDDPDSLLRLIPGVPWYGWPDYSTDLQPVSNARFQPKPIDLIIRSGYPQVLFLIDQEASGLTPPSRDPLLQANFPSQSGAAKLTFVPASSGWNDYRGDAIICMDGDHAPFATSGQKLNGPIGYKVVLVNVDTHEVTDFVHNTVGIPRHLIPGQSPDLLERPTDAKFGPDGMLYILDYGRMRDRSGKPEVAGGTGQIFRLMPTVPDTTPKGPIGR
jgi:glucose/arabinose dehydrogenase